MYCPAAAAAAAAGATARSAWLGWLPGSAMRAARWVCAVASVPALLTRRLAFCVSAGVFGAARCAARLGGGTASMLLGRPAAGGPALPLQAAAVVATRGLRGGALAAGSSEARSPAVPKAAILGSANQPDFDPKALGTDLLRTLELEEM